MNIFPKPSNLNGAELQQELAAIGLIVDEITDFGNGTIGFETEDKNSANQIVKVHNGTIIAPEPTVQDKLASVGLSIDDLKTALGL